MVILFILLFLITFPLLTVGAFYVLAIFLLMIIGFIVILAIFEWIGNISKGKDITTRMRGVYSLEWNSDESYVIIKEINFKNDGFCDVLFIRNGSEMNEEYECFQKKYYIKTDVCYEFNKKNEVIIDVPRCIRSRKVLFIRGNDYILLNFNEIKYEKIDEDKSLILKFLKEKEEESKEKEIKLSVEKIDELDNDFDSFNSRRDKLDKLELVLPGTFDKIGDKKKLSVIRRILKNSEYLKPLLSCFSPLDDGRVVFTDAYQLYILNDEYLPFDVAFMVGYPNYKREKYLEKFKLEKKCGDYLDVDGLIPKELPLEKVKVNIKDFLENYKQTKKEGMAKRKIMNIKTIKFGDIYFNGEFLRNAIDILKLKEEVELEIHGELKPIVIHNKDNELALIMPTKKLDK